MHSMPLALAAATPLTMDHMKIELHINPCRENSWVPNLTERLASRFGGVAISVLRGEAVELPAAVQQLLNFEDILYRRAPTPAQPEVHASHLPEQVSVPYSPDDLVIELAPSLSSGPSAARRLRVLFDGVCDDAQLYAAYLSDRLPHIEIADASSQRVLAAGIPCTDNATSLKEAVEYAYARVVTLVMAALENPRDLTAMEPQRRPFPSAPQLAVQELRNLAAAAVRRLYRMCCYAPHWQIGWRWIEGPGVMERGDLGGAPWHVLADPGRRFYADPMPIIHDGRAYIFFEDLPHATQKGVISYVEVIANGPVGPVRPVLEEPWHLSYPFLIGDGGQVFMIPEASASRKVTLYRADPFPGKWVRHATLLSDIDLSDATVIEHHGRYWMFGTTRDGAGSPSDTLSIFHAPKLEGPWLPHGFNPVLIDPITARPAGPCVLRDGKIWRVTQDCSRGYGKAIALSEILVLEEDSFAQRLDRVVRPDAAWRGRRFHHLARAGNLECVDGSASAPKSRLISQYFFPGRNGKHVIDNP